MCTWLSSLLVQLCPCGPGDDLQQTAGVDSKTPESVLLAKQTAKEMEKWEKEQQKLKKHKKDKDVQQPAVVLVQKPAPQPAPAPTPVPAPKPLKPVPVESPVGLHPFAIHSLKPCSHLPHQTAGTASVDVPVTQPAPSIAPEAAPETAPQPKQIKIYWGSDEWHTATKSAHVNVDDLICLLCERKFDALEKLEKHVRVSQLHKDRFAQERTRIVSFMSYVAPISLIFLSVRCRETQLAAFEAGERKATYRDRYDTLSLDLLVWLSRLQCRRASREVWPARQAH